MGFDFSTQAGLTHLHEAINYAYGEMRPFRRVREIIQDSYRGQYYGNRNDSVRRMRDPVNPLNQYVNIMVRTLVQSNPRVWVGGEMSLREAKAEQAYLNRKIQELDLFSVLRDAVREAITGYIGVVKVGIAPGASVDIEGVRHERGQSYMRSIPLDRWFWDMQPDHYRDADFMGHMFERRTDELLQNPMYDRKFLEAIAERGRSMVDMESERPQANRKDYHHPLYERTALREVYLPREGLIVTYSPDYLERPARVASVDAPEWGPYLILQYEESGQVMPNATAAQLIDTHDFVNLIYRKTFARAYRAKEVNLFDGGSEDDAERLRTAKDGEWVRIDGLGRISKRTSAGVDPLMMNTAMHARRLFDELSGNVRSLGGIGPIAETARQEAMIQNNISRVTRDMQLSTIKFTRSILQALAWYERTDVLRSQVVRTQIGRNGLAIHRTWTPELREGDDVQYDIDIEPDSLAHRSAAEQFEQLMGIIERVVYPGMQLNSDRPITLKLPELLAEAALRNNLPELSRVVDYALDDSLVHEGIGTSFGTPGPKSREKNGISGRSQSDPESAMMQGFLSAGSSGQSGNEDLQ